jgi:hypothetical protein
VVSFPDIAKDFSFLQRIHTRAGARDPSVLWVQSVISLNKGGLNVKVNLTTTKLNITSNIRLSVVLISFLNVMIFGTYL